VRHPCPNDGQHPQSTSPPSHTASADCRWFLLLGRTNRATGRRKSTRTPAESTMSTARPTRARGSRRRRRQRPRAHSRRAARPATGRRGWTRAPARRTTSARRRGRVCDARPGRSQTPRPLFGVCAIELLLASPTKSPQPPRGLRALDRERKRETHRAGPQIMGQV
jgi:hypothetical protein